MTPAELIAALDTATGPSRELDAELGVFFSYGGDSETYAEAGRIRVPGVGSISSRWVEPRHYTASWDAVMSLARTRYEAWRMLNAALGASTDIGLAMMPDGFWETAPDPWSCRKAMLKVAIEARLT